MVGSQYKPAEVARLEWDAVRTGPPWAVDSWGLGCMMQARRGSDVCALMCGLGWGLGVLVGAAATHTHARA
jgi:hypothetical protein